MKKKETLGFADQMILVCRRKDGSIKWKIDTNDYPGNSITNVGMAQVAGLILTDVGGDAFDFIGIGTDGTTAESAAHTDLQTSVKRKAGTGTRVTTIQTNDTAQLVTTFSSADTLSGSSAIAEGGVFTAVSAGVMLFRKIFTAKTCNWDDGDTLEVTAKCQMKQGA